MRAPMRRLSLFPWNCPAGKTSGGSMSDIKLRGGDWKLMGRRGGFHRIKLVSLEDQNAGAKAVIGREHRRKLKEGGVGSESLPSDEGGRS
ncbi:hypothetical protein L2E82_01484 [Cichorium intybus]|uniref:Uncharacterized protein n=1 Tax=Cichorium intybus TaxID=13427 RepID=A0ACB9H0A2_CICIN|nr:hypothetical protein L2E82_01484 [Cichorium intybus]